jgi:hypothetical protein
MLSPSVVAALAVLVLATAWSVTVLSRGGQIEATANTMTVGVIIASLMIALTAGSGPEISGLPVYGLFGCVGTTIGGICLLVSAWRRRRKK